MILTLIFEYLLCISEEINDNGFEWITGYLPNFFFNIEHLYNIPTFKSIWFDKVLNFFSYLSVLYVAEIGSLSKNRIWISGV